MNTESPCVRNCCLDKDDICIGCFRSMNDIVNWSAKTEIDKQKILRLAQRRKKEYMDKQRKF